MGQIHTALAASDFVMPRALDPTAGSSARHHDLFNDVPPASRPDAIRRAVKRVYHRAVPPEMCETAREVALAALPFGFAKRTLCGRDSCPCGSGDRETPAHTFATCTRTKLLWDHVLRAWRETTGEVGLQAADHKLLLF